MSENVAQTVQKVIQDLVAPDVRELKALTKDLQRQTDDLKKHMDQRFEAQDKNFAQRFDAQDQKADLRQQKIDAQFASILSAIKGSTAETELSTMRQISALSERISILESRRQ